MVGSPGLYTTFWSLEALGQCVECLEAQFAGYVTLIFGQNLGAELLLEILTDHPHDFAESSLDGVVDTIVHDGLAVGAQTVELLQGKKK